MQNEIWIANYPDVIGGAATECLSTIGLLRRYNIEVHLTTLYKKPLPDAVHQHLISEGVHIHDEFHHDIYKHKIVVSWASEVFLDAINHYVSGSPRAVVWFNCMTAISKKEYFAYIEGNIDYYGFVSDYQRKLINNAADRQLREVPDEKYMPFYDPNHPLLGVNDTKPASLNCIILGRISRDDPSKFSRRTFDLFNNVDTFPARKGVLCLGAGPRALEQFAVEDYEKFNWTMVPAGGMSARGFYREVDIIIHATGGSRESFGRFVLEAACARVPVVVERDFAFPELIIDGVTGCLCRNDFEMVTRATELAKNRQLREGMADRAYKHVTENLIDPENCIRFWHKLLSLG